MGKERNAYKVFMRKPGPRDYYEELSTGGNIILKWTLEKLDGVLRITFIWFSIGASGRFLSTL
jgi:hypothetical protein